MPAVPQRGDPPATRNWPIPHRRAQVDRVCQQDVVGVDRMAANRTEGIFAKPHRSDRAHFLREVVSSVGIEGDQVWREKRPDLGFSIRLRSEEHTSELQSLAYLVC